MIFVSFFSFPESYAPLILRRRARRFRKQTNNSQYYTESERLDGDRSTTTILMRALSRPLRLLAFHPIIQMQAVFSGFEYGLLYIVLSTFSDLWKDQYHHSVQISGLHYISVSLGEVAASQIGGPLMDYFYKKQTEQNKSPESRVPLMYPGLAAIFAGLLIYGWTAEYRVYWLIVDIGAFILTFGMQLAGLPSKFICYAPPFTCFIHSVFLMN